jgi:DNA-directed RNA polymerase subunit RPC12/RpoP
MKIGFLYPEFQCPYCGIDIEDKGNKLLNRVLFQNINLKTKITCGNCHEKILLCLNDMEGKLMPYKNKK